MSAHEFAEWLAWEQVHGPLLVHERVDLGLARLAQMWGSRDARFADFLPQWYQRGEPDEDEMLRRAQAFAASIGAEVRVADDQ